MSVLPAKSGLRRRRGAGSMAVLRLVRRRGYVPLLHRVAGLNVLLVLASVAVTVAVLSPGKVSSFALDEEIAVLLGAVAVVVAANVLVVRRLIGPIQALTALTRRVDLTNPGQRMPAANLSSEAGELARAFNDMLSRLELERRQATGRVLEAQEAERLRIAQELHDQVGQELTAVLLGLSRIEAQAPPRLRHEVLAIEDVVRGSIEDVRRIAIELRPEALDDLGLASALAVLAQRLSERLGLDVDVHIDADLPELSEDTELVVYRVAQEALTNAARHSGSDHAELMLAYHDRTVWLSVRDDGCGLSAEDAAGTGIRGMHERAALIGARLEVRNRASGSRGSGSGGSGSGCEVHLKVPLEDEL